MVDEIRFYKLPSATAETLMEVEEIMSDPVRLNSYIAKISRENPLLEDHFIDRAKYLESRVDKSAAFSFFYRALIIMDLQGEKEALANQTRQ